MAQPPIEFALADENATARLGAALALAVDSELAVVRERGLFIGLSGDLGAGKTALVRAMLRALGVTGPVRSPTFALVEPYVVSSLDFYHFDFYRLTDPREFALAGFREMFGEGRVCLVEWPEKAAGQLPAADLQFTLRVAGRGRIAAVGAASELGSACLQRIAKAMNSN
jgi:tRNA threonylcarbamoyladenosine biosynthesis protein TsaE